MKKLKFIVPILCSMLLAACGTPNTSSQESFDTETSQSSSQVESSEEAVEELVPNTNPAKEPPACEAPAVSIHFYRKDHNYKDWALWLWATEGKEYEFNGQDSYGAVAKYPLSLFGDIEGGSLGFIVKVRGTWSKDVDMDRFINFSKFTKDDQGVYHVYLKSGDKALYVDDKQNVLEMIESAAFIGIKRVKVFANTTLKDATLYCDGAELMKLDNLAGKNIADFRLKENADFTKTYTVKITFKSGNVMETPVSMSGLFGSSAFGNVFNYDGELGALYTKESTTFKVWSPISSSIKVRIYNSGTPLALKEHDDTATDTPAKEITLTKGDKGVFTGKIDGDLAGKYYTYVVTNAYFTDKEIVDPYALSAGVNGVRGMIVDFDKTNPEGWNEITAHQYDRKSLTVYETHVSDISSSPTWSAREEDKVNAKKFKGAYTKGTTYTKNDKTVSTGFDHIKELGVNAVQLVPVFDQANDEVNLKFNWGYNPLNYNVLEGGYSSNPFDGYTRIKEFKELVKSYHDAGINIIMDVVYNHVAGAKDSNWDVLMPGYFYRYKADGALSNGSGCGNETASELFMVRKFMIDSTAFLAKEYKLGGFRFDLMALHDVDTMNQLTANLKTINPSIAVYGEPWTGGESGLSGTPADQSNANLFEGYGQFNDQMRDAILAGGLAGANEKGWVSSTEEIKGDVNKIVGGIKGYTMNSNPIYDPDKTINYVTCHDNFTLTDRYEAAGITDAATRKSMAMLSNSIVLASQGTAFMLAGEEFLRTKGGDHNSYESGYEVNELNYALKIEHADMFENYKKLIALKQDLAGLHLSATDNIKENVKVTVSEDQTVISTVVTFNGQTIYIMHRNGVNPTNNVTFDLTGATIKVATVDAAKVASKATVLKPFETIVAVK